MASKTVYKICPACGNKTLSMWYSSSANDPEDVDPRAHCSHRGCDFAY